MIDLREVVRESKRIHDHHTAIDKANRRKGLVWEKPKPRQAREKFDEKPYVVEATGVSDTGPNVKNYDVMDLSRPKQVFIGPGHPKWDSLRPEVQAKIVALIPKE